ncbi:ArsR family transcriptional regulator [Frondihabitans sp. PhB188]|uniref:ArsR/SmtB family transcription factor n=1 Tax=Frondihabitans sp. PhB188 TaxID=2485200 RepID=UPI000F490F36|nr:helix-turn-helix domain-containing protein [Frondihabitans sp. PhB188]ROQ38303.1 ArsR family transcriptional regulator [Frondihabitans sp. PhB188]
MSDKPNDRALDAGALRAMAHPLRVELYEALSNYGPATASGLAERLGESSGSTSYHLRQLARHGLVREVEGRGSGRERWWERSPGSVSVSVFDHDTAAGRAAAQMVGREWERVRAGLLAQFQDRAEDVGKDWYEASTLDTLNLSATRDELREIGQAFTAFYEQHIAPLRAREPRPGARRVQIHFNAFPIADAPHVEGEHR